jgi:dinuclear metal center YbgI/SA1388 family protein
MKLKEVIEFLENLAPPALQESYDNAGLQTGNMEWEISGMLITLDVNYEVIEEAISKGFNCIISHHPVIFRPLKKLTGGSESERCIIRAIREGISIYVMHTNYDNARSGLNYHLARKLGIINPRVMEPGTGVLQKIVTFCPEESAEKVRRAMFESGGGMMGDYDHCSFSSKGEGSFRPLEGSNPFLGKLNDHYNGMEIRIEMVVDQYSSKSVLRALLESHPYEEVAYDIIPLINVNPYTGAGSYGALESPLDAGEFMEMVKKILHVPCLKYSGTKEGIICNVGVCGGSGAFLISKAKQLGLDAMVTADVKYHQFQEAGEEILLLDAGHYETEIIMTEIISESIQKKFTTFATQISAKSVNPVLYF